MMDFAPRSLRPHCLRVLFAAAALLLAGIGFGVPEAQARTDQDRAYAALRKGAANFDHVRIVATGAARGDAVAAEVLAWLFATGTVVPKDKVRAVGWYVQAASAGAPRALGNARVVMESLKAAERTRLAPSWLRYMAEASVMTAAPTIRRMGAESGPGSWVAGMLPAERDIIARLVVAATAGTGVSPSLAKAVAKVESNFRADAHSPAGARGVMQIMPATAQGEFGVHPDTLWDARHNAVIGVRYLDALILRYGAVDVALSYYNGGASVGRPGMARVTPWTRHYVDSVLAWERVYANRPDGQPSGMPMADPRYAPPAEPQPALAPKKVPDGKTAAQILRPMG
jgi:soluble lytic murein transglycosylase-like protein